MTTKVNSTVLNNTDVTSGTYGGSTRIPFFTVDAQGRITSAANVAPSIATNQLTGKVQADQLANNATFGINITGNAGTADSASTIPVTGISGTHYVYTSANRPGTTRLYRRDDDSAYNIQTFYNGTTSRWALYGYNDNTAHAGVEVAYANTAGSAPASDVYSWAKAATRPTYSKSDVGLGNVDNTADANKSVSYAATAGSATTAGNGGVTSIAAGSGISVSSTTGAITVSAATKTYGVLAGSWSKAIPNLGTQDVYDTGWTTPPNVTQYAFTSTGKPMMCSISHEIEVYGNDSVSTFYNFGGGTRLIDIDTGAIHFGQYLPSIANARTIYESGGTKVYYGAWTPSQNFMVTTLEAGHRYVWQTYYIVDKNNSTGATTYWTYSSQQFQTSCRLMYFEI